MLGWLILFAVMLIVSLLRLMSGASGGLTASIASLLFAALLLAGILTRAVRGRAW